MCISHVKTLDTQISSFKSRWGEYIAALKNFILEKLRKISYLRLRIHLDETFY